MADLELPPVAPPAARYVHTRSLDRLFVVSGQIGDPGLADTPWPDEATFLAQATSQAALAATRVLAVLREAAPPGARIQILRLGVFIVAPPGFQAFSTIADGASAVIEAVLGPSSRSARTAVGVAGLPRRALVEIDAMAVIDEAGNDR